MGLRPADRCLRVVQEGVGAERQLEDVVEQFEARAVAATSRAAGSVAPSGGRRKAGVREPAKGSRASSSPLSPG